MRAAGDGDAVVQRAAPHEVEDVTDARVVQRVGQPEVQVPGVPGEGLLGLRRVDHDVREPDRNVFLLLDLAVRARGDLGRDLDRAAVDVEEPEAVPAAWRLQVTRLADQGDAGGGKPGGEGVDVRAVTRPERQEVDPLLR